MNIVKITYLILSTITSFLFLAVAIAAPIIITPGYYYWTVFCVFMIFACSHGMSVRLNSWEGMGNVEV